VARTTEDKVGTVVEIEAADDITPFITTANIMVTKVLGASGYDVDLMEIIERYYAAHLYRIFRPQVTSESVSGVSESITLSIGQQLKQTTYGQQVLIFDVDGYFNKLQGAAESGRPKRSIKMTWLGKETA
jgi:hypothetical protein